MSRTPVLRGTALAAALLAALPALSACGIGKSNETERVQTSITARNGSLGDLRVRAAYVATDPTSDTKGYVVATLATVGPQPETLTAITSDAGTVTGGTGTQVQPQQLASLVDPSTGMTGTTVQLEAHSPLVVGTTVPVTFVFQSAGSLTMQLPVEPTTGTTAVETPAPTGEPTSATPSESPSASPSPSATPSTSPSATP